MSREITLTSIPVISEDEFQPLLDEFEERSGTHVNLQMIDWEKERSAFTTMALQHQAGDVAIVGAPVTSDLAGMNALLPLTPVEISAIGGADEFLPSRWRSGSRPDDPTVWAVPWMVDFRVLYYWKEALTAAGVNEAVAFQTTEQVESTVRRLSENGAGLPFAVPYYRYNLLHFVSSYIWEYGGDLFARSGRSVTFHEPQALDGIRAYLRLLHYFSREGASQLAEPDLFVRKQAAITVAADDIFRGSYPEGIGCVAVPGGSYLGGTDVIVWTHTHHEREAFDLLRFLAEPEVQLQVSRLHGMLPPRMSALNSMTEMGSAIRAAQTKAVLSGRAFPNVPMMGLVEDRLSMSLHHIQQTLLADPEADVEDLINRYIISLGNRLNLSLGSD